MGCKQTTAKSPSFIFATSPTTPSTPIYAKSALKKSRIHGTGKTEKLSISKRKTPLINKSVNFDEKVQVKLRTPTPKQTRYENTSSKIGPKQTSRNDDDDEDEDDDDQLSSISSLEDTRNEQIKTSIVSSTPSLQRNQPNGFWYKNNAVSAVFPLNSNLKEKPPQPPINPIIYPSEDSNILQGNRFRIRRKVQQPVSSPILNPSPTIPVYRTTVPPVRPISPVQRPLPNTNHARIEHPAALINQNSSPQPVYYAFDRRTTTNKTSKKK